MLRLHLSILAVFALLATDALAGGGKKANKENRAAVKETVAEQDGPEVPPEMRTVRADARMEKMRQLIVQGIKDKQLTTGEQTSAIHELQRIEREEETYKHNKNVGPRERHDLNRDINKLHEHLFEKTHNGTKPTEPLAK